MIYSTGKDFDTYGVGDVVPIIVDFFKPKFQKQWEKHVYYMTNTIEGLKAGDMVAIHVMEDKIYPIRYIEGLQIQLIDEESAFN